MLGAELENFKGGVHAAALSLGHTEVVDVKFAPLLPHILQILALDF